MSALDDLNNLIKADSGLVDPKGKNIPSSKPDDMDQPKADTNPTSSADSGEDKPIKVQVVPEEDKRSWGQKQAQSIEWSKLADKGQAQSGGDEAVGSAQGRSAMRRQSSAQQRAARASRPPAVQKAFNPALASLLAVAAGVVASDAFVSGAGGRTNKDITAGQLAAFKQAGRKQTKARQQTKKSRTTRAPVKDIRLAYKEMAKDDMEITKAHAPVPPIQGLVWDQGAQKWRKPENVGKTATEVQGKKRIRGSGLGQQSRSAGGSGSGKGRGREFAHGRRSRAASGDIGVAGKSVKHGSKKRRSRK